MVEQFGNVIARGGAGVVIASPGGAGATRARQSSAALLDTVALDGRPSNVGAARANRYSSNSAAQQDNTLGTLSAGRSRRPVPLDTKVREA